MSAAEMPRVWVDASEERLYEAYRKDRDGTWHTPAKSHSEIVADGVFSSCDIEAFALRYSLVQAAYVDAMIQGDKLNGWLRHETQGRREYSTDGRLIGAESLPQVADRALQP